MRSLTTVVAVGILVGGWSAVTARGDIVFDFESLQGNADNRAGDYTTLSMESDGVVGLIYRTSLERFTVWDSGGVGVPDSWGSKHLSPVFNFVIDDYLVMSFLEPMKEVTIEFGDYGEDHDVAELFAYSGEHIEGDLLGHVTDEMGDNDMRWDGPTTLTFAAQPGEEIWSIKFRGGEDPFLQSTFIDNIVTKLAVPTPGTLAVLGLGCALGAGRFRRRESH
jgi:hypothetical protein